MSESNNRTILKVTEIYTSIQGESSYAGLPCVFVRLSGCPLRCRWCDTVYSFKDGKEHDLDELVSDVKSRNVSLVELTGGEPLAQPPSFTLITKLLDQGLQVLIETGGSEPIEKVDKRAHIIMDLKCPGSGMHSRNLLANIEFIKRTDEIKFVIASRDDFDWMHGMVNEFQLENRCRLLLSAAWGLVKPDDLVAWMLESKINARLNLQIHKYVWGPRAKGV